MVAAEAEEGMGEGVAEGKRAVEALPGCPYLPVSSSGGSVRPHAHTCCKGRCACMQLAQDVHV